MRADPAKLQAAIDVFAEPERWTTGYYARSERGHAIGAHKPDAVRFDIEGALQRADIKIHADPEWRIVRDVVRRMGFDRVNDFNDAIGCSQDLVVFVLTEARDRALHQPANDNETTDLVMVG